LKPLRGNAFCVRRDTSMIVLSLPIPLSLLTRPAAKRRVAVLVSGMRSARGAGSVRQRRPGVWEVRVAPGPDPVSGVSRRRSITIHGDEAVAEAARRRCAEEAGQLRARLSVCLGLTVGELLTAWLDAEPGWRPSTLSGYRFIVRFLAHDRIAGRRAVEASPMVVRAAAGSVFRRD